ncbi:hypothetical protein, partial [Mesorhizobium sp. M2C.T.Ca.TU.002.02.1.1]|uniref:hypothetical protein n=1 Tax=Mesorhizobium sp. M2C.T.Ca.TU.002.02.1.1 TaxID=2496788 RepID=UPI0019D179F2
IYIKYILGVKKTNVDAMPATPRYLEPDAGDTGHRHIGDVQKHVLTIYVFGETLADNPGHTGTRRRWQ